jgi:hypothetical protein
MKPMLNLHADVKDRFFDRAKVLNVIGRENARRLSKMGAYVRQRAKTDILRRAPKGRKRKGAAGDRPASPPGRPPYVHSRDSFATFRNILFALDTDWESVVIGVRYIPRKRLRGSSAATAAELNELGGTSVIQEVQIDGVWVPRNSVAGASRFPTRKRQARYPARPFMGPALKKEIAAGTVRDVFSRSM